MQVDDSLVVYIATTYYNILPVLGSIKQLPGYDDRNFLLTDSADNKTYVLKIVNRDDSNKRLTDIIDEVHQNAYDYCEAKRAVSKTHFVVVKLIRTTGTKLSTFTTVKYRCSSRASRIQDKTRVDYEEDEDEKFVEVKCNIKLCEYFDGLTIFEYINNEVTKWRQPNRPKHLERLYNRLGRIGYQVFAFVKTQQHLFESLQQVRAATSNPWLYKGAPKCIKQNLDQLYPETSADSKRALVLEVLDEFNTWTLPKLSKLSEFVLHSDLSTKNLLIEARQCFGANQDDNYANNLDNLKICVIDWQDLQTGPQISDLANLMLYSIIEQVHTPLESALTMLPRFVLAGYQSSSDAAINDDVLQLVPSLMKIRLCQSLLNGRLAYEREPENSYVLQTNQQGWQLLELMCTKSNEVLVQLWLSDSGKRQ